MLRDLMIMRRMEMTAMRLHGRIQLLAGLGCFLIPIEWNAGVITFEMGLTANGSEPRIFSILGGRSADHRSNHVVAPSE